MEKVYICNNANSIVERLRCLLSSMEPKEANDNPGSVVTRQNRSPERGNKNAPWPAFGDASTTSVLPSAERCDCAAAAGPHADLVKLTRRLHPLFAQVALLADTHSHHFAC